MEFIQEENTRTESNSSAGNSSARSVMVMVLAMYCLAHKKKKSESVIHSVFNELTWQKALVAFLGTTRNEAAHQLTPRLQQLYHPALFYELSHEFAMWKILHALNISGGTCSYSAYELIQRV